jgi:hypothetical protein
MELRLQKYRWKGDVPYLHVSPSLDTVLVGQGLHNDHPNNKV